MLRHPLKSLTANNSVNCRDTTCYRWINVRVHRSLNLAVRVTVRVGLWLVVGYSKHRIKPATLCWLTTPSPCCHYPGCQRPGDSHPHVVGISLCDSRSVNKLYNIRYNDTGDPGSWWGDSQVSIKQTFCGWLD